MTAVRQYLARRRADRALLRLARKAHTVRPDHLANDPERSPDWCHRHGCPSSQCPGPN